MKQGLKPIQIACAGGRIPIDDGAPTEEDEDDEEEEEEPSGKKKKKKEQQYSDFAFTSKLKRLVEELKEARDKDPTCK